MAESAESRHLTLLLLPDHPALQLQFSRQPTVSRRGTAAVVDGTSLLLTPLRHTGAGAPWDGGGQQAGVCRLPLLWLACTAPGGRTQP